MQISSDVQSILARARAGERLSESDRLTALEALDTGDYSAAQLAEMLGVSTRQIHRDRARLRERYQQALRDLNLVGELYRQFEITLARMDQAIAKEDYQRVRALALRWGVCESFARLAYNFQLDELARLVERIKATVHGNGLGIPQAN
jgi:transposase-like protein